MGYVQTYSGLWLCSLDREQNARTCNYWYTLTTSGATPHNAFRRRESLLRWLSLVGLKPNADVPQPGDHSCQRLIGTYRTEMHLYDLDAWSKLVGVHSRTLSNGDYVRSIITNDPDGIRTVHTLNPNVKGRQVFDYQESEKLFA